MSEKRPKDLPRPFGKPVPVDEWKRTFLRVCKRYPDLNLYDGVQDYSSRLLHYQHDDKDQPCLQIDSPVPDAAERLIFQKVTLLVRAQYFEAGIHHRLSFDALLIGQEEAEDGLPIVRMRILPPVQQVSNIFVAMPSKDRPVYLEVPIEGAPPTIRVLELSQGRLKAFMPNARRILPKNKNLSGIRIQLFDVGEAVVSGTVVESGKDEVQLEINAKSVGSQALIEDYLEGEFSRQVSLPEDESDREQPPREVKEEPKKATRAEEGKKKAGTALIIVQDDTARERLTKVLEEMGWQVNEHESFSDTTPGQFERSDLLVLSTQLDGKHAVDRLQHLISDEMMLKKQFILVGAQVSEARQEEWPRLGKGVFIRNNAPKVWIERKLKSWFEPKPGVERRSIPEEQLVPLILVVDDEPASLEAEVDLLKRNLFRTISANNGWDALRAARNLRPDLILLDIEMLGMTGIEMLKRLFGLELTKNIPVIMLTGRRDEELVAEALGLGVKDYIVKPFVESNLIERIRAVL
ncbi:MAG: response regulator [bacterium]